VKALLIVLGMVAAVVVVFLAVTVRSLSGPSGWEPPEVAPLAAAQHLQPERLIRQDDGYVLAGVAGTNEPWRVDRCTGRFVLVFLDERGSARRAVVPTGPERDRNCAHRTESVFPDEVGGWFLSGWGQRRAKPSPFDLGPAEDLEEYTLRFSADGAPDRSFGDLGLVRGAAAVGRAGDVLVTRNLERITADGTVRDDLLEVPGSPFPSWSGVVSEGDLVVAFDAGLPLSFQTFAVDRSQSPSRLRALTPEPRYPERTIGLGDGLFNEHDVVLHGGHLYVVLDGNDARLVAADPRRRRLVSSFGRDGSVALVQADHVSSAALDVDGRGRLVVAFTTIDHIHGYRLHARRFAADGSPDRGFGGFVRAAGDRSTDLNATDVFVDAAGRTLLLDRFGSTLTRLTVEGRLDRSFGRGGVVSLASVAVCGLPPARDRAACRP
jgi:hypothetical protein